MDGTQKLIRCTALNTQGEQSIRFVELASFKLWKYMMQHNHGMQINNITLCLWMNKTAYQDRAAVNAHCGVIEAVDQIVVSIYDQQNRFSETVVRFTPHPETEQVTSVLTSHVAEQIKQSDSVEVEVKPGYCVIKTGGVHSIHLGLSRQ